MSAIREELQMVREAVRGNLEQNWPPERALKLAAEPAEVAAMWQRVAEQGVAALGAAAGEGGLAEALIAMEELGRAACPVPMAGAIVANFALGSKASPEVAAFLADVHAGRASVSLAFGSFDPDANAGALRIENGAVSGKVSFVEGMASASHLLAFAEPGPTLVIVARTGAGVSFVETPGLASPALAEVTLSGARPIATVPIARERIADLILITRLALAARALGAANRGFELVLDYAKLRKQFDQPIGKFQAIQHKLADCLINLQGVQLALANAAASHDGGNADWRVFASAACAFATAALRQVSLETHHTYGAIGYSEEHEAPRHFKRIHSDVVRHGGVRQAREELAEHFLGGQGGGFPEYDLGEAGNAFRSEVRTWMDANWTEEMKAGYDETHRYDETFAKAIGKTGWLGLDWPKRFGGQERMPREQLAFREEIARAGAPHAGAPVQAIAVMQYGTPAQQEKFLGPIQRGEMKIGMGYSEPDSGSDLASLRTKAERDGDGWVINGQKIWTTGYWSDFMWLAARTDTNVRPKHAGISMFMVPMDTPGITVRPMNAMYGGSFANIFYDNVKLPADALVGPLNGGWKVLMESLASERVLISGFIADFAQAFEVLAGYVRKATIKGKPMSADSLVRDTLGGLAADLEVGRQLLLHSVTLAESGVSPIHEAAIAKVFSAEFAERFCAAAQDLLGMGSTLSKGVPGAIPDGRLEQMLRESPRWVIHLGTNEIQRNLIAQRGLGLPR